MNRNDPRDEDAGYGASSLVGSDRSGLRSAIEAREAVDDARRRGTDEASDDARRADADLGRLADGGLARARGATPDSTSGPGTLGDATGGTRASAGRRDVDRDSRDRGNSLQE